MKLYEDKIQPNAWVPRVMLLTLAVLIVLTVFGCTTLQNQSLDQKLYAANQTVTAIEEGTDAAFNAHLITKPQAQAVSNVLHQVNPLIDAAHAAERANDPTSANKTMNLITALLAGLQAYVPKPATAN